MWILAALDSIWDDVIQPENCSLPFVSVFEFLVFFLSAVLKASFITPVLINRKKEDLSLTIFWAFTFETWFIS
jgi:hypothetical protein